jgi:phosphoenolpyruvate-protein kinase (PTS system EI component)
MELDEFSMAPSSIPRAKAIIRKWSLKGAKKLAAQTIKFDSAEAVREKVKNSQPL